MSQSLGAQRWPALPAEPTVLLPLGSTEQHGPHLPLDTDTRIAAAVANAMAARIQSATRRAVLVAPALAYGASGEHQAFPGTVSIGNEALRLVLVEAIRSLATWAGWIILVNGHGGNASTVAKAVEQMRVEQHQVTWVPCSTGTMVDAHAGHHETSLMLHLDPGHVQMELAVPGRRTGLDVLMPELVRSGVRAASANGILGDPTHATAEEGASAFEQLVSAAVDRALGEGPIPPRARE